ncbi:hypothetical protein [Bacillus mojavensis]
MKSLVISDLLLNFINSNRIAYCYMGERRGTLALHINNCLSLIHPEERLVIEDINKNFELWAFIDEIEDEDIRLEAVNMFFCLYCKFYNHIFEGKSISLG